MVWFFSPSRWMDECQNEFILTDGRKINQFEMRRITSIKETKPMTKGYFSYFDIIRYLRPYTNSIYDFP